MSSKKVDVSIAFYGKPYQTIVTIKTMMQYSGQHIDKFILSREVQQPHDDYIGIYKVLDYFKNDPSVKIEVFYPKYFLGLGAADYQRAKTDTVWRRSILYQQAFESTDKKYLCITHNDVLYYGDIVGEMLTRLDQAPSNTVGIGAIGQCWSCPAGPNWANVCNSTKVNDFVPTKQEAIALAKAHATPRQAIQLKVIEEGRVHPLPECRMNEFCSITNTEIYRKETLPYGDIGCFGGGWGGIDTGTIWSHDIYKKGYRFENIVLEDYCRHAPFDDSGSGTKSNNNASTYFTAEQRAQAYIEEHWGPIRFSSQVTINGIVDQVKRKAWLMTIHTYGFLKNGW